MEMITGIKVKVILNESKKLERWIEKQPETPWIVRPDYEQANFKSDIALDGVDITIDKNGKLNDIGFSLSVSHLRNTPIVFAPPIINGDVIFFAKAYLQATEVGDQDIVFDKKQKIIRWQYNSELDEQYVRIAENVIIGIMGDRLQSISVKILKQYS